MIILWALFNLSNLVITIITTTATTTITIAITITIMITHTNKLQIAIMWELISLLASNFRNTLIYFPASTSTVLFLKQWIR